ncbi:GerW family sporulation protein [Hyalangium versicolor]|uniref:GerW family sporulation protein n=1 Tax=Hyalangium versicolor TaxID=2861190 RepID=UPI001CCDAF8B|nr:spore germination protein GerW family protein [Hyalangium versicolor]
MDVSELLDKTRGDINARHVFGEPVQQGDAIIIPAAKVRGGGGGGEGKGPSEQGSGAGSGFGLSARPAGAFVIREGLVRWRPAIDVNRVILGGQIVMAIGLLVLGTVIRARQGLPGLRRPVRRLFRR